MKTVNYDCRCGDVIKVDEFEGLQTIESTWPNGVRMVKGGHFTDITYSRLRELNAVYVQEAPAPKLPTCSGLH